MITIVGLGPSGCDRISVGARQVLLSAPIVFVRTAKHPAVDELRREGLRLESFDHIYESADTFSQVYATIAELILEAASREPEVVYAVPGHPLAGEEAVRILIREASNKGMQVRIIGSESFIEATLEALCIGFSEGIKVLDALSMDEVSADTDVPNLIYQVYDRLVASEVKLKLMEQYPDDFEVSTVTGAGTPDQKVHRVPLYQLDRCPCDHLTTVYVPPFPGTES